MLQHTPEGGNYRTRNIRRNEWKIGSFARNKTAQGRRLKAYGEKIIRWTTASGLFEKVDELNAMPK
ncbi:hypothetical protein D1BOALGB6SA_3772 [Olavius sp. associated proteobacterium Delta 1]|nr:hypothetical protein D1BOALGB6SA_3772 [Olavius sp. associated proteobacterium Delta 1]